MIHASMALDLSKKYNYEEENDFIVISDDELDSDYGSRDNDSPFSDLDSYCMNNQIIDLTIEEDASSSCVYKRRRSIAQSKSPIGNKPKRACSLDNLLENDTLQSTGNTLHHFGSNEEFNLSWFVRCRKKVKKGCRGQCRDNCERNFTSEDRANIHNEFWSLLGVIARRKYIVDRMAVTQPRYTKVKLDGKRGYNFAYHFFKDGIKIKVCKQFFIDTLDISTNMIRKAWSIANEPLDGSSTTVENPDWTYQNSSANTMHLSRKYSSDDNLLNNYTHLEEIGDADCKVEKRSKSNLNLFTRFKLKLNKMLKI